MQFSDLALSRRLERAEGHASAQFAETRRRLFPDSSSEWMQYSGAYIVFDGIGSPVTQTFGLGIFEELNGAALDVIERFFLDRGAQVDHEVSPHAGVAALGLLCSRGYQPIEISNVMYRPIEKPADDDHADIKVHVASPNEAQLWTDTSARGWTREHPKLLSFFLQTTAIATAREQSPCFLARHGGEPGAAGSLCISNGGCHLTVIDLRPRPNWFRSRSTARQSGRARIFLDSPANLPKSIHQATVFCYRVA